MHVCVCGLDLAALQCTHARHGQRCGRVWIFCFIVTTSARSLALSRSLSHSSAGTIWMQEILPLVLNGGDLTPILTIPNWDRVPWLEEKRLEVVVDQLASPRAMVTHFPCYLMPPSFFTSKAKVNLGQI